MFEHMHGQDAVEIAVRKIKALLAIAEVGLDFWTRFVQAFGHVLAEFDRDIVLLLLGVSASYI